MKRNWTTVFCVLLAAGLQVIGETPYQRAEIAYRGKISAVHANPISEYTPIPMVFRLYNSIDGTEVFWGRKLSVAMRSNGTFAVKLGDHIGTAVSSARHASLVEALAATTDPYIGLTPGSSSDSDASLEFPVRQRLVPVPEVRRAHYARVSDLMSLSTLICGTLVADTVKAANVTVRTNDTLLASTDVSIALRQKGAENILSVDGAPLEFNRFDPPMTEMSPASGSVSNAAEVAMIAICADDAESDVKSVGSVILLPGERPAQGAEVLMTQKFGEGK